ncbi:MAG TPA: lanthionine synthetase C family protein [Actinomycetota bacterium]|nr:lanthionine synthetase C family protein [Actinomycetota bacterium]
MARGASEGGDPSLSRGLAGAALALRYLAVGLDEPSFLAAAGSAFDRAADALTSQRLGVGVMQGFTGVGWTAEHLHTGGPDEDPCEAIDEAVLLVLRRSAWPGDYDLVSGLVGVGIYALERIARPHGPEMLERVVAHLAARARPSRDGLAWFTEPAFMPPEALEHLPDGYFNVGVAHGVPGVIALLASALQSGVAGATARRLLEGAVDWTLAQRLPAVSRSIWPYHVGPGVEPGPARVAWCYGDPGIAIALLRAGLAAGRDDWVEVALEAALRMLERDPAEGRVDSASLCHGSAGVAQICLRLNHLIPDARFVEGARRYLRRALEVRVPELPMAGYTVWDPESRSHAGDVQGPGFLAGVAGIALALLSAATETAPDWDRALLLSGPVS